MQKHPSHSGKLAIRFHYDDSAVQPSLLPLADRAVLSAPETQDRPHQAASTVSTYALTSNVDTLVLDTPNNLVIGTLGAINAYGTEAGGTFNSGDYIDGGASNQTTLQLQQNAVNTQYGAFDVMPVSVTLDNIQTMEIYSVQALGGIFNGYQEDFDTSSYAIGWLDVQSSFGEDYIKAASGTNVTVVNSGPLGGAAAAVNIYGGDNIVVTELAGLGYAGSNAMVTDVTGTVSIDDQNNAYDGTLSVAGGTAASVTGFGTISVSGVSGTVSVSDGVAQHSTGDFVSVSGGGAVTVTTADGTVEVYGATGLISIADGGDGGNIAVGGNSSAGGTVSGYGNVLFTAEQNAPSITVNQSSAALGDGNAYTITTEGGQNVTINNVAGYFSEGQFVANANTIDVGLAPDVVTSGNGTQYDATSTTDSTGTVVVNDMLDGYFGTGSANIYTDGATSVAVNGTANGIIEDVGALALVREPGGASTPGTSNLANVSLFGVGGTEQIVSDALRSLSIIQSGNNSAGPVAVTIDDRTGTTLDLTLANDRIGTALTDNTAKSIRIASNLQFSALDLSASSATSLFISGQVPLFLSGAAGLGKLRTITVTGGGGISDGGTATGLMNYASLKTIDASAASGAMTVAIGPRQSFAGGSGVDTVTLSSDQLATVTGGNSGQNVLVANAAGSAFTANTKHNVTGFEILRTTQNSSGSYNLKTVFDGITNVDVSAAPSASLTFVNTGAAQTLSIDRSLTNSGEVTLMLPGGMSGATQLTLDLGTASMAGIGAQTVTAQSYASVTVNSLGSVNPATGLSSGVNGVTLADAALSSLVLAGQESLAIGSTGSALTAINATATAASATLYLQKLGVSANGVTLTDGAATVQFGGNVSTLKTDTVTFQGANSGANVIAENGSGALVVNGSGANGANTVVAQHGVLDAVLGNGANTVEAGNATASLTAGNGRNHVIFGNGNDQLVLGNGNNTVQLGNGSNSVTLGTGTNSLTLGNGADNVTLQGGTDTVILASAGSASVFANLGNVVAGDTVQFLGTNGTAGWEGGTTSTAQIILAPNATFTDYLNAAGFSDGAVNSQLAWFDFKGFEYLVENNSNAGSFVSGTDLVVQFSGSLPDFNNSVIDTLGNGVTFHS